MVDEVTGPHMVARNTLACGERIKSLKNRKAAGGRKNTFRKEKTNKRLLQGDEGKQLLRGRNVHGIVTRP